MITQHSKHVVFMTQLVRRFMLLSRRFLLLSALLVAMLRAALCFWSRCHIFGRWRCVFSRCVVFLGFLRRKVFKTC